MISTLLFVWHKVSSLPPPTQNLNLRFHLDHEYLCPINLHTWTWHFCLLFCMSITIIRLWKRNNHGIYLTFCMTHKVFYLPPPTQILNLRIHPDHEYQCPINLQACHFQLVSLICMSITIMRLEVRNNHDIYFDFCQALHFLSSSLYPKHRMRF